MDSAETASDIQIAATVCTEPVLSWDERHLFFRSHLHRVQEHIVFVLAQLLNRECHHCATCAETIQIILLHELYPFISFLCDQNPGKTCSTLSRSGADSKRVTNGGRVGRRDPSLPTLSQPWVPQLTKGAVAVVICFLIFRNTQPLLLQHQTVLRTLRQTIS